MDVPHAEIETRGKRTAGSRLLKGEKSRTGRGRFEVQLPQKSRGQSKNLSVLLGYCLKTCTSMAQESRAVKMDRDTNRKQNWGYPWHEEGEGERPLPGRRSQGSLFPRVEGTQTCWKTRCRKSTVVSAEEGRRQGSLLITGHVVLVL